MVKKIKYLAVFSILIGGWSGKVVDVINGETIKVHVGDVDKEIVLWGVKSSSTLDLGGIEVQEGLRKMVLDRDVEVEEVAFTPSELIYAKVYCGEQFVNAEMVFQGLAAVDLRFKGAEDLSKLEFQAKFKKLGMWARGTLERTASETGSPRGDRSSPLSPRKIDSSRGTVTTSLILEEQRSLGDYPPLISPRSLGSRSRSGSKLSTETKRSQEDLKL